MLIQVELSLKRRLVDKKEIERYDETHLCLGLKGAEPELLFLINNRHMSSAYCLFCSRNSFLSVNVV